MNDNEISNLQVKKSFKLSDVPTQLTHDFSKKSLKKTTKKGKKRTWRNAEHAVCAWQILGFGMHSRYGYVGEG